MTRLTEAIERAATAAEQLQADPSAPRFRSQERPTRKLEASTLMLSIPGIGEILREQFKPVPAEQVELAGDQLAITCGCGRELTLSFGDLVRCSCWRFYFNGKTLRVTEPAALDEIVTCDDCDDDVAVKDGAWARVHGDDRFLCPECHGAAEARGDVDLPGSAAA